MQSSEWEKSETVILLGMRDLAVSQLSRDWSTLRGAMKKKKKKKRTEMKIIMCKCQEKDGKTILY